MLELIGISKEFRTGPFGKDENRVLNNASLRLDKGEIVGVVGESGCGKSTLARIALKLIVPDRGRIILDGVDVTHMPERKFRKYRHMIQIVFQHPEGALDPHYTLMDAINEALDRTGLEPSERRKKLSKVEEEANIPGEILNRYPDQVSGGEVQRVVLARVLALDPAYLVLDEPTSMLDVSIQAGILRLIKQKAKEGTGVILISHDADVIHAMCDRVYAIKSGELVVI